MTDEMLVAQAEWLPQFAGEIPLARERLAQAEGDGTRVKTYANPGAARLHTRSVEEMARDQAEARANAGAADKGKMTKNA
jgi:alpha-galactosidase